MTKEEILEQRCLAVADALPKELERYRQIEGTYDETCGCCVGAHLAHHYRVTGTSKLYFDFELGKIELSMDLDYTTSIADGNPHHQGHVGLMQDLHACGAPQFPFSADPWTVHPRTVFRRLAKHLGQGKQTIITEPTQPI